MTGRLIVLGGCGAWPEPRRACSGFLLEYDGFRVVLDLGYGTLPRLLTLLGSVTAAGVDGLVVTHEHPDHMVDLHGLFRARWFGTRDAPPIPLYAPEKVLERVGMLEDLSPEAQPLRAVFDWHPLPAGPYAVGPFVLESRLLPHYVPNAGVRRGQYAHDHMCAVTHAAVLAALRVGVSDELVVGGGDDDCRVLGGQRPANPCQDILDTGGALARLEHHCRRFVLQAQLKPQKPRRVGLNYLADNHAGDSGAAMVA